MARENAAEVAYVPFKTFLTSLDTLRQGVPDPIDRSVFGSQSGSTQGMLLSSYKALGLINEGQHPEPILYRLVDPEKRKAALLEILREKYADVTNLGPAATQKQFDDLFYSYGVNGDTHKKAKSFFLQAAAMAGISLSPHIAKAASAGGSGVAKPATPRKKRTKTRGRADDNNGGANGTAGGGGALDPAAANIDKLLDKFPPFDPAWPDNLKEKWFDGFGRLQDELKK